MTRSGRRSYWPALAVLLIGLATTAVLVVVSHSVYAHNEKRLLVLRAKEAESLLTDALPGIQTPLASAAALADATHGNPRKFRTLVAPYVGTARADPFVSVSLWRLGSVARGPKAVVGVTPELSAASAGSFLGAAPNATGLSLMGLLGASQPRLGYAFSSSATGHYVVYGESAVPKNRRQPIEANSPLSDLSYAIYLGRSERPRDLLLATASHLPLPAPTSRGVVPFGNGAFTLVVSPRRSLAGGLPQRLPLIIALAGLLLTLLASALTSRLVQRQRRTEHLAAELERAAAENRRLYAEQRNIAQTLQHALLPESLPSVPGLDVAGRYVAGETGMDIGGDWYDVIPVTSRSVLVAVGDVSGKGLRAAATMASLRFAIHAYAVQEDPPALILSKLSRLLSVTETGQLATVLCAMIDLEKREIALASAGHLPPLLVVDGRGEYIHGKVGVPIGVEHDSSYPTTTVSVASGATFLAFTDGLVERRDESIDAGLARLRAVATANHAGLSELLNLVLSQLHASPAHDDTAIVGVRWKT